MQKVSYIPLENILADDPCQECQKKVEFLIAEEAVFDKFILASTAHERTTLVT